MTTSIAPSAFTKRLGVVLQQQRRSLLSQAQLAEQVDLSTKYIGEIERGEANVTTQAIERIANVLGWDPWALFSLQPPPISRGVHRLLVSHVDDARQRLQAAIECLAAFDPANQNPALPELPESLPRRRGRPGKGEDNERHP